MMRPILDTSFSLPQIARVRAGRKPNALWVLTSPPQGTGQLTPQEATPDDDHPLGCLRDLVQLLEIFDL